MGAHTAPDLCTYEPHMGADYSTVTSTIMGTNTATIIDPDEASDVYTYVCAHRPFTRAYILSDCAHGHTVQCAYA